LSDKWSRYQYIATVTPVHLRGNIYSLVVTICASFFGHAVYFGPVLSINCGYFP